MAIGAVAAGIGKSVLGKGVSKLFGGSSGPPPDPKLVQERRISQLTKRMQKARKKGDAPKVEEYAQKIRDAQERLANIRGKDPAGEANKSAAAPSKNGRKEPQGNPTLANEVADIAERRGKEAIKKLGIG